MFLPFFVHNTEHKHRGSRPTMRLSQQVQLYLRSKASCKIIMPNGKQQHNNGFAGYKSVVLKIICYDINNYVFTDDFCSIITNTHFLNDRKPLSWSDVEHALPAKKLLQWQQQLYSRSPAKNEENHERRVLFNEGRYSAKTSEFWISIKYRRRDFIKTGVKWYSHGFVHEVKSLLLT